MTYCRNYFLLASCLVFLAMANISAQEQPQQQPLRQSRPFENYSAKVMNVLGSELSTPRDLYIKIYFYTPPEELEKFAQILSGKDSQAHLQEELRKHFDMGRFQLGTDLSYAIKLIREEPTKKGRHILLVANRYDFPPRSVGQRDPRECPFIVLNLDLDDKNTAGGSFILAAKLRFNKQHGIEVEDFCVQPATITSLQREGQ